MIPLSTLKFQYFNPKWEKRHHPHSLFPSQCEYFHSQFGFVIWDI